MVTVAEEWFAICAGCEVAVLDIGDGLLDLLPKLQFVHMPVLVDHKYFGQRGERHAEGATVPAADVGIITGSIRNEEHVHLAKEMREKCKVLIALGSCSAFGGIPALANLTTTGELVTKVYRGSKSTPAADPPSRDIPPLLDRVYSLAEVVKPDVVIPGCPPEPTMIAEALVALLEGKPFALPQKSVCDDCPTKREKKAVTALKRPLEPIPFEPLAETRCFMEQGFLCLGPNTRGGCAGKRGAPRCIESYMPCRGCFGPVRDGSNPMVDMVTALASVGLDAKDIPDRTGTFNRYSGAQGRLRPPATRRQP